MTAPSARRAAATALALAFALAVPGCGASVGGADTGGDEGKGQPSVSARASSPPPSPSATGTPKGDVPKPEEVDQNDADEVGEGTLTAMWTYDTAVDSGTQDAGTRAADAGWLTESYARQLRERHSRAAPGAQWGEWTQHRAYTTVKLTKTEDAAKPADTDTVAWRQWTVTTTPHGRDGWKQKPTTAVAYVHLVRSAAAKPWRVTGVTVR
ncbi:hypothetical protein ACTWQF_05775 [Streptomyces sp. 8N114]|uniref:hypothetical protein n=1 Tax=Streptomyces sp. 8N114 TaxID=3457419 RepID=UPI003FD4A373